MVPRAGSSGIEASASAAACLPICTSCSGENWLKPPGVGKASRPACNGPVCRAAQPASSTTKKRDPAFLFSGAGIDPKTLMTCEMPDSAVRLSTRQTCADLREHYRFLPINDHSILHVPSHRAREDNALHVASLAHHVVQRVAMGDTGDVL